MVFCNMAIGDTARGKLTVTKVEDLPASADVRHFDELSHGEQRRFLRMLERGPVAADEGLFTTGEIVVFTEYYRIRRR